MLIVFYEDTKFSLEKKTLKQTKQEVKRFLRNTRLGAILEASVKKHEASQLKCLTNLTSRLMEMVHKEQLMEKRMRLLELLRTRQLPPETEQLVRQDLRDVERELLQMQENNSTQNTKL
jgi:Mg2+ and Co2+ transporter CorA